MTFLPNEDQITKLMNLLKIPLEKRNFEELQDQIQKIIEANDSLRKENSSLMAFYLSKTDNTLEKILNNPGLQHLAENIFNNLKYEDLEACQGINQSCKQILEHQMSKPMFLLRKFRGLSEENQKDWIKEIESTKNATKKKAIIHYLQWNLKKDALFDLPCNSNPAVQDKFRKKIW